MYGAPRMRTAAFRQEQIGHTVGRGAFIAPDQSHGARVGTRSLSVGRKVYTWDANPDTYGLDFNPKTGEYTRPSRPMREASISGEGFTNVGSDDQGRPMFISDREVGYVRTVAHGDELLPRDHTPAAGTLRKGTPTVDPTSSTVVVSQESRETVDARMRATIGRITGKPFTGELTPAIRARFVDFLEETRQLEDMGARAAVTA